MTGEAIINGFFASKNDILLPIQQKPSDNHLTLVPSTKAFLARSKQIHTFLSLPLVPFQLTESGVIQSLRIRRLIDCVDKSMIEKILCTSSLSKNEFIKLVHWLFSNDIANERCDKNILFMVSFHDPVRRLDIQFRTVKCYDALNTPLMLNLPINTLPRDMAAMFSKEQLEKQLSLVPLKLIVLLNMYFDAHNLYLLKDPKTSACLLSFISTHLGQLAPEEWKQVKTILSQTICISTTKGMKMPSESFVPSELLSPELPAVLLNIISDEKSNENVENPVSTYFLKQIGCRTVNIDAVGRDQAVSNNSGILQAFIQNSVKQRNNLSEADFKELKTKKSLRGSLNQDLFIFEFTRKSPKKRKILE